MNITFGLCEVILILSYLLYSSDKIISLTLLSVGILGGIIRYCSSVSNNGELALLKKRVIMSNEERKRVLLKMYDRDSE